MKRELKKRLVMVALVAIAVIVFAQTAFAAPAGDPVGTAVIFDIGMGARALGMGGAFVGIADDANASLLQPGRVNIRGRTQYHVTVFISSWCRKLPRCRLCTEEPWGRGSRLDVDCD